MCKFPYLLLPRQHGGHPRPAAGVLQKKIKVKLCVDLHTNVFHASVVHMQLQLNMWVYLNHWILWIKYFVEQKIFPILYPGEFLITCKCMSQDLYAYIKKASSSYFITFTFLGPSCTLTSLSFLRRNLPAPLHLFWAWRTFSDMSRILWTLCLSWSFFSQPTWTSSTNTWSDTLSSARPAFARACRNRSKGDN